MKQSCRNRSDQVWFVTKTKQNNDVIDQLGLVNAENDIELLGPIWQGIDCGENQIGQQHDQLYRNCICQNWNWDIGAYRIRICY